MSNPHLDKQTTGNSLVSLCDSVVIQLITGTQVQSFTTVGLQNGVFGLK